MPAFPAEYPPKCGFVTTPFADEMRDEEVAAVAAYVRNSWGNKAGAVTAAEVAKHR